MKTKVWIVIITLMMAVGQSALAVDYPEPTAWVNDYAGVLSSSEEQSLNAILKEFETKTTNQIFVAIQERIPGGMTIEEYAVELFERWQPGQAGKDNGVLLLIFTEDRKLRIEVGYGLEGQLTDAASKLIIENDITPHFKQGDYYSGISNGVKAIILTIDQDYAFPAGQAPAPARETSPQGCSVRLNPFYLIILFWIVGVIIRILSNVYGHRGWSTSTRGWSRHPRSRRYRRKDTGLGWIILGALLSSGGRGSGRSSSGGGFGGFSGGGGGSSGGGGASGGW
ncbi:hypothetical protein GF348_03700 [candidate division KSB3 bacterium]|nr:hypothetical protein [candidate division KSB3 bacterium]